MIRKRPMQLTEKQKEHYLTHSAHCPFCGSDDILGEHVTIDCGGAYQEVSCIQCKRRWYDTYTLTSVEEAD